MIEHLDGTCETISYKTENGVRLYHNAFMTTYPFHWHSGMEIIMPCRAQYIATIKEAELQLEEGDICIIPPGELHSLRASSKAGERIILQLNHSILFHNREMYSLITLMRPYFLIRKSQYPEIATTLATLLLAVEKEYFNAGSFYETRIFSLLADFFVQIGRNPQLFAGQSSSETISQHNVDLFLSVCSYINSHFKQDLTLLDVAKYSGFSKSHFCRFFKIHAGKSFYDYLLNVRISNATDMLLCNEFSILDIALASGFNSISTFNRVFRTFHHCSPSEYRHLHLG